VRWTVPWSYDEAPEGGKPRPRVVPRLGERAAAALGIVEGVL